MSSEPQLYRVNPESRQSERIEEVNFDQLGLKERQDIQEWVANNPTILGDDLLIVGKEFSGFDRTNERLDLLAVDLNGKLVIIELKRDDTGADAHWQAIKYASYLRRATHEDIVDMLAKSANISTDDAGSQLMQHLGADDLNALNNDQRIILASHRFAPEVTSASLWLNEKAPGENLITCVTLTPYRDETTGSLYIQASTIIPVPGIDDYVVGIGNNSHSTGNSNVSSFGEKLRNTFQRNKNDDVTHFLRKVSQLTLQGLSDDIRPNKTSRWAGRHIWPGGEIWRYYHFWYLHKPWGNWRVDYRVNVWQEDEENIWAGNVEFRHTLKGLRDKLTGVTLDPTQLLESNGITVQIGTGALNDEFANRIADMTRKFIEQITPLVDDLDNESDE